MDHLVDARVSEAFRVHIPERPTFSLLRSKAGVIGRPIGETSGTVVDQVAARAGVIRVSNGFRCPDDMSNGGTFTDAMGTTCGVRVVMGAVENLLEGVSQAASGVHLLEGRDGGKGAAVIHKNEEVLGALREAGGEMFKISDEYAKAHPERGLFGVKSADEHYKNQREKTERYLNELRHYLTTGEQLQYEYGKADVDKDYSDRINPALKDLIKNSTNEELLTIMENQAVEFHRGVSRNVRVSIPAGRRFETFLEEGRYLTTHETTSDHSDSGIRSSYEQQIGIPGGVPISVRPASGYVTHPDIEQHGRTLFEQRTGIAPTEFTNVDRSINGPVSGYGEIELILRPEVAGRSGFGLDDSISTLLRPASFDETDPKAIFAAMVSAGGKYDRHTSNQALALLESSRTGSFAYLNARDGAVADYDEGKYGFGRSYFEALVLGSFGTDDVAAVKIDYSVLSRRTVDPQRQFSGEDAKERTEQLRKEFFATETLAKMGFNDEEIQYLVGLLDNYQGYDKTKVSIPYEWMNDLDQLLAFREARARKTAIEAKGIEVKVTHEKGVNPFDPELYGAQPGADIEQVLVSRFQEKFPRSVRERRERTAQAEREKAERAAQGIPEPSYG